MAFIMKLNKEDFRDKVYGCWVGKNIGGTLGTPYEGLQQLNDIKGFSSEKGEPLPNDDLDLQLVWLKAMEDVGSVSMSANVLADYWLTQITPHWNEYGVGKSNLEIGLLPPLSGEYDNVWKNSNGAWIRSEIWASMFPGLPEIVSRYAIMDASIDHGLSEGTYAEVFTATLESMAYFESDIRTLVEKALLCIPENCRVARAVRIVLDSYDKKIPWIKTRELILEDSKDLGWFQAPANLAFTVLGLIYGEGDFKQSLIYAVNCGDDTDCTGATVGAVLGIILGAKKIPEDWKEYIGDRIITVCINGSYTDRIPKTCTELTDRVLDIIPHVLKPYYIDVEYTDEPSSLEGIDIPKLLNDLRFRNKLPVTPLEVFNRKPNSFEIPSLLHTDAYVEYETDPVVKPNTEFKVKITFINKRNNPYHCEFDIGLPEGWTADCQRSVHLKDKVLKISNVTEWEMTINVGEKVEPINRIPVMVTPKGHAVPVMIPLVLLG